MTPQLPRQVFDPDCVEHPLMLPKNLRWSERRHFITALAICLVVSFVMFAFRGRDLLPMTVYSVFIGLPSAYSIRGLQYLLSRWLLLRRPDDVRLQHGWVGWGWASPCIVLGSLVGYVVGVWGADQVFGFRSVYIWEQAPGAAALSLILMTFISLVITVGFYSYFRMQALQLAQADAQRQAAEARLTLLQSQLEPHMLFNTLANLRVLIKLRPDDAQTMLDELIAYLRATLQASRSTSHALRDEFARLGDYLALMQRRMGTRLQVHLDLPAELAEVQLPPLLLQPLVENAIKHGLEPHVEGGRLVVSAQRDGDQLVLRVQDNGAGLATPAQSDADPFSPQAVGTGFGLAQVRERLLHRYGAAARFELQPLPAGGTEATITLPAP
ncbi:sensor histidine kinase [Roseateles sp.]|uniref:sensor histidine kinase n=1 Tax=Roseateles sp. TaxID=1971397 RepID=UPI00394EA377